MQGWMKLSDMVWPEDHAVISGAPCVVAHVTQDGKQLYQELCIAKFNMEQGFFIAEDDTGPHAINPGVSGGEVYFLALPPLEVGGKLLC
jgi:hypothetical protein